MPDTTTQLDMPFILPSQAQKHITHNEALLVLDTLVHLTILSELSAPPTTPAEGNRHLVGAGATGEWTGKTGCVAAWQDGAWTFLTVKTGWRAWFAETSRLRVFDGATWRDVPLPDQGTLSLLGINAVADATNRLSLSSPASLFNHVGNGHQIKVNKAAATDTASLLFQSNWTGFAEMGLAGNTEFSIKISDGTTWRTGLAISPTGRVSRPNQPAARAYRTGTTFTPTSGQQSGFTTYALNQGSFGLGASAAGGGNGITVPAAGIYLVTLNLVVTTSSGHGAVLLRNGTETLMTLTGITGGAQSQSASGVFSLSAGDSLTLQHSGTAQVTLGAGKTELSLTLL